VKRRIILLGPPGSGKGTIAARLQQECGLKHVSSGHLFRREVEQGSEIGRQARGFLDQGELVPDDFVLKLMAGWLRSVPSEQGFVLDGFPRNLKQAKMLESWLAERKTPIEAVIALEGDEQLMVDRMTGRRTCPQCGRVYHLESLPPQVAGQCDDCRVGLVQRDDDSEPLMRKRMGIYLRETKPVTEFYRRTDALTVIPAELPVETRLRHTMAALNK
jgi:adenylate kinase